MRSCLIGHTVLMVSEPWRCPKLTSVEKCVSCDHFSVHGDHDLYPNYEKWLRFDDLTHPKYQHKSLGRALEPNTPEVLLYLQITDTGDATLNQAHMKNEKKKNGINIFQDIPRRAYASGGPSTMRLRLLVIVCNAKCRWTETKQLRMIDNG